MNDEMRSDAVDRQLAGRHEALIRDLANTLDLDAGLNAALLPGGYADLIEDVRNVLDVDAGLTAIVPRSVGPADESGIPSAASVPLESTELHDVLRDLASLSLRDRLEFRTHSALPSHAVARLCGCVRTRALVLDLAARHVDAIDTALDLGVGHSVDIARSISRPAVRELASTIDRAKVLDRPFDEDLDHIRKIAHQVARSLDIGDALRRVRDMAVVLAQDLDDLDRLLNDYIGIDLEDVDLRGIRLRDLRWSPTTKWPRGWSDRVRRDSTEITPGVFVIRGDDPVTRGPTDV